MTLSHQSGFQAKLAFLNPNFPKLRESPQEEHINSFPECPISSFVLKEDLIKHKS